MLEWLASLGRQEAIMNTDRKSETTDAPDWWTESGERYEARRVAGRIRDFLSSARLLSDFRRRQFEIAAEDLEAHGR